MQRSERCDAGSSPAPGSNSFNHVAVTGTATAAPAKRVDAGSSPARNSISVVSTGGRHQSKSKALPLITVSWLLIPIPPGWQMRLLHPTENREEYARYVPQAPVSGDSTSVQTILASSSWPERYRLSPPIALVAQRTERQASTLGPCGFESCRGLHRGNVHVAQWTRAETSEASGCAFESRRGLHFYNDMSITESWPSGKAPRC